MFQQKHLRDDAERTKAEETESVMLQETKKINVRQLTDQWIEEIRADLSPNLSEENRGKIVSARLNERIRATMAADPEFEQAFIQSELENDVCYVQALIRKYITDTRLVDPEDPEVSEATLIENALWALAEIEGPAEQLKLLRERFEKLQSALPSAVGSPSVNLILTPIIGRLKDAIVDLQEYFRTKYHDNYNATCTSPQIKAPPNRSTPRHRSISFSREPAIRDRDTVAPCRKPETASTNDSSDRVRNAKNVSSGAEETRPGDCSYGCLVVCYRNPIERFYSKFCPSFRRVYTSITR
jgi:hypothetical protein